MVLVVLSLIAVGQIKTWNGRTFSRADIDLFLEAQAWKKYIKNTNRIIQQSRSEEKFS